MGTQDNDIGNFSISEDEANSDMLNIFSPPERNGSILLRKEQEIRIFTVLEKFVVYAYLC